MWLPFFETHPKGIALMELPEHNKVKEVQPYSQKIHEFFDWLQSEKGMFLSTFNEEEEVNNTVYTPVTMLVAEFFEIDLNKLEKEKEQILELIRKTNEKAV